MSISQRRPSHRGVYLTEVSISLRCLSQKGVHLTEVSISQRCLFHRGVHPTEVSILQRCPSHRGVYLTEVSISQRCLSHKGVRLTELSVSQRCPLRGSWLFWSSPGNRPATSRSAIKRSADWAAVVLLRLWKRRREELTMGRNILKDSVFSKLSVSQRVNQKKTEELQEPILGVRFR